MKGVTELIWTGTKVHSVRYDVPHDTARPTIKSIYINNVFFDDLKKIPQKIKVTVEAEEVK